MTLPAFYAALGVTSIEKDGEVNASDQVAALITSAVHDKEPRFSLSELYHATSVSGSASLIDPLNVIPSLLFSKDEGAKQLLDLLGQCGSAKEVVIAVQEAVERLQAAIDAEDEDDTSDNDIAPTIPRRLITLMSLYAAAIPRLKLRKRSPAETLKQLVSELQSTVEHVGRLASTTEGRVVISSVSQLIRGAVSWVNGAANSDATETVSVLEPLFNATLATYAHCIGSSLAQRSFEKCFPRLAFRSLVSPDWEQGESIIAEAVDTAHVLGITNNKLLSSPSISSVIVLAHSPLPSSAASSILSSLLPVLVSSIQANHALDESLSLLLNLLSQVQASASEISPEVVIPLSVVLPSLASAHPDPPTRHLTFRILALLLSLSPPPLRLEIISDLATSSDFPQMSVAAVSLIKEAALAGLPASAPGSSRTFTATNFLRIFGPILFRTSPPDLLSSDLSLEKFQNSQEYPRLVECLSVFYLLLQRDQHNETGIRAPDTITGIELNFLRPLRTHMVKWAASQQQISHEHTHATTPLAALEISLQRVDDAIAGLPTDS